MLKVEHVYKTFLAGTVNENIALVDLNLHLSPGEFVSVIGGNGAGKSTMLNAIAGTWPIDAGRILVDGEDVTALPDFKRAKLIGRVFQDLAKCTSPDLDLEENLALSYRRGQ
ncbi:MAG: ATP-binding cassette domain-containing protein [Oscillospiraceae bacterium]|nr:ATP-binding cassette domain-containing protein [Oscillospiraceae bacterium]